MPLNKEIILAIDGGGTKTDLAAGDVSGHLSFMVNGPSTNVKSRPAALVKEDLFRMLDALIQEGNFSVEEIAGVSVAAAGGDRPEDQAKWKEWFHLYGIRPKTITIMNDCLAPLVAATKKKEGLVLIAGTGSIAYYFKKDGSVIRAGGWGYLLGDEGSGYDIGNHALRSVLKHHDGRRDEGEALTASVLEHFGLKQPMELITHIYEASYPRETIAGLGRRVIELAREGNKDALEIMLVSIRELEGLLSAIYEKEEDSKNSSLVISGGLFQSAFFKQAFESSIRRRGMLQTIIHPEYPPVIGAYICALLERLGHMPDKAEENIEKSWQAANRIKVEGGLVDE
ncbi:N-acetylglucosamine kinase [Pradoshia sp.]